MEVDCAGCAGCCLDWRPLVEDPPAHERRGSWEPLDEEYNLVPLTKDDVSAFLDAGLVDALAPRLWKASDDGITLDNVTLTELNDGPVFFLGLRKPPKPVAPFDIDPTWLPTCVFLDPATLQCRIHEKAMYPTECGAYPGHNLEIGAETECERVEEAFGGERLLETTTPENLPTQLFGTQAVGFTVFRHPDPRRLEGTVERLRAGELTQADRAEFVAAAMAGSPGTTAWNEDAFQHAYERAISCTSWAGEAAADWERHQTEKPDPTLGKTIEEARGAPQTPGWE